MAKITQGLPITRGLRLRATRVGRCGIPLAGPNNVIVTNGFIEFQAEREMSDGEDIEQKNAAGEVCIADRTDDQFKRFNLTLQLCGIHPDLIAFFTDQTVLLDADGDSAGLAYQTGGNSTGSVALEIWTTTGGGDDCEVPTDDSIFATLDDGEQPFDGWYFNFPWVRGGIQGDFTINGTDPTEITVTGYTGAGAHWGRGPYNVERGPEGEAQRLLEPIQPKTHAIVKRTTVRPPEVTSGATALTLPQPYFAATDNGGNGGAEGNG